MISAFEAKWKTTPALFEAHGRVNLIGEFTDYNEGFVMPMAIPFCTWVAAARRVDRILAVDSENFEDGREFDLDDPAPKRQGHWSDYVRGVGITLQQAGYAVQGANLLVRGEVPIGAGLSSSAALEVATARALLGVSGIVVGETRIAQLCQRAENEFVGVKCGIMDQFSACHGKPGHALMLDCRSLEFQLAPLPKGVSVVICNTMVRHELASGEYNKRRADCTAGVDYLARKVPHVRALRDVTPEELEKHAREMPDTVYRRCRHVVRENRRVEDAFAALKRDDVKNFGKLMYASHASLRDDFEVSCRELDAMVEIASRVPGVYGARMTGGGFGGCSVNLLRTESVDEFRTIVARDYAAATGRAAAFY
jgi:galactokinase